VQEELQLVLVVVVELEQAVQELVRVLGPVLVQDQVGQLEDFVY
jgi:hypothetical protein